MLHEQQGGSAMPQESGCVNQVCTVSQKIDADAHMNTTTALERRPSSSDSLQHHIHFHRPCLAVFVCQPTSVISRATIHCPNFGADGAVVSIRDSSPRDVGANPAQLFYDFCFAADVGGIYSI